MSAGSAHAQIPTRVRLLTLDDLLVDARRDPAIDVNRLGDVLERPLAEALEDEGAADSVGGGGTYDDLAALGRAGEARRPVGRRPRGGERPALPGAGAELGRADERLAGVDAHVELDRREHAAVL